MKMRLALNSKMVVILREVAESSFYVFCDILGYED